MQNNIYVLGVLLCSLGAEQTAPALPPTDHAIWKTPDFFAIKPWANEISLAKPAQDLKWTFRPDKTEFLQGETISGRLSIEHQGDTFSYKFSPPYHGQFVSTISLWRSKWNPDKVEWGPIEEVYQVNHGHYRYRGLQYQGKPIVLAPGARYEQALAVNVLPSRCSLGEEGWYSGIGCAEPGKYRFYLRYVNLQRVIPFARRGERAKEKIEIRNNRTVSLPLDPIVLEPFEVTVSPLTGEDCMAISGMLNTWNKLVPFQCHYPHSDNAEVFEQVAPSTLNAARTLSDEKQKQARLSFTLTDARFRLVRLPKDHQQKIKALRHLEKETAEVLQQTMPRALADAWRLTQCQILHELGRDVEARKLAEATGTPDTAVFAQDALTDAKDRE